jgi:hypothetical protein
MEENKQATEANDQKIATGGAEKVTLNEDLEARNAVLEAEKVKLLEETVNYKAAYLKEKAKQADGGDDEERLRRIAREELSNSRLAEIAREQDTIIKKALKENKELKLAQMNKTDVSVSIGSHSEGQPVRDTLITPDQMAQFKSMGKSDKWIENYKKNLIRNTR